MSEKYKNKYRIKSARMPSWDYGSNGMYFITICTQNREHFFGDVIDGKIQLSEIGIMANKYWNEIPQHFSFAKLGEFVVMPNHIHGILIIEKMENDDVQPVVETLHCNVSTTTNATPTTTNATPTTINATPITTNATSSNTTSPSKPKNEQMSKISPKSGSVSTIIRSYKSVVTKKARKIHVDFGWQPRFHDHIIRNEKSFQNISNYIINNPKKWVDDKFFN